MNLYVEKDTPGVYGLIDTFINETVTLTTKTTYVQDITAVFKGFTNSFSVQASPNNIKLLSYFGYTEQLQPASVTKRAKLYLDSDLYKEGIIKIEAASWVNGSPSLFQLEFSDGQKNLTEILGEDTLASLNDGAGDLQWTTKNIQKALQGIQTASGGLRWFIPLVSTERIFSIYKSINDPLGFPTDNIGYNSTKPITSENILLPQEIRPAVFMSEVLQKINEKYDIKIDPTPYINGVTQLTDLCAMCVSANVAVRNLGASITKTNWNFEAFREERFDIKIRNDINGFELNYLGYGSGSAHDATFDMYIQLAKTVATLDFFGTWNSQDANKNYINSLEVWEVNSLGGKVKKLNYAVREGSETKSAILRIRIGLDVFYPEGSNQPSTAIKPLIAIFAGADSLSEWKYTNVWFNWSNELWKKIIINNVQTFNVTTVNLFESLPEMKLIDFVKSIYTMFGYKKFKDRITNEFYYVPKTIGTNQHTAFRIENDLTPYADLSKLPKKVNTKYDGYNLKHVTSEYQQNIAFEKANGMEYGQLIYPNTGKPKSEFKIETKFTAPVFSPVATDADAVVNTFYPFGSDFELNEAETRQIYETITDEFPIFYYNGVSNISTPYGFVDTDSKTLKAIGNYHKISHRSTRIFTGTNNYITSLFNIITGDYIDQNTLYVQDYKNYIEDTLSGKRLIHSIDLNLPPKVIKEFEDDQEIIIKETKYNIMESAITITNGKTKLTLLNK